MQTVAGSGDPGAADGENAAGAGRGRHMAHGSLAGTFPEHDVTKDLLVPPSEFGEPPSRQSAPSRDRGGGGHRRRRRVDDVTARRISKVIGAIAVAGATVFVVWQLRLGLIFSHNMDVGGDNGGHVAGPYFLIHHLLPHGRLTGWDPWWFDGMPLYVFYFPLPALLVGILSLGLPYNEAFNVVTILGTVTLPVCAWAFGALAGFRRPVAVLMALATLPFIFNTSYTIDGGNLTSTLAGEFSFSLAISTGLLFLGVFAYTLRTGRLRWLAAGLFGVTVLCHMVPALAFAGVAALMAVVRFRLRSVRIAAAVGGVGALLAAFWLVPFGADLQYSSSMGYLPVGGLHGPLDPHGFVYMLVPAALGMLIALVRRDGFAAALGLAAAGSAVAFWKLPSGLVYNGRWLPFWFLFVGLLAAYGIGEAALLVGRLVQAPRVSEVVATAAAFVACAAGAAYAGGLVGAFPGITPQGSHIQVQGWVSWNYTGFQGKSGWPQFAGLVRMLDRAGARYGCGRLQYEYISETTDPFGSTEAMMSLPMWTKGCMQTTDGIYFESSTTTPFHFLDVSEVSQNGEAPDPISYLTYPGFDVPDGVRHLQLMGVRYFLAMSPPVEAQAATDHSLVKIGEMTGFAGDINNAPDPHPVWQLYLVKQSPLVVPLSYLPEVEPMTAHRWLDTNLAWYERESYWPVELARSGPASWPHQRPGTLVPTGQAIPVRPTVVSRVRTGDSSISFHVSRLGSPVLVRIPYFPNWEAVGATGPYEASPNVMVVVPTSHEVRLVYGTDSVDWAGKAGSLAGLAGLGLLAFTRSPYPGAPRAGEAANTSTTAEPASGGAAEPATGATTEPASGGATPAALMNEGTADVTPASGATDATGSAGGTGGPSPEAATSLPTASWWRKADEQEGDEADQAGEDDPAPGSPFGPDGSTGST